MSENEIDGLDPEIAALLDDVDEPSEKSIDNKSIEKKSEEKKTEEKLTTPSISDSEHIKKATEGINKEVIDTMFRMKLLFEEPPDKKDKFMYREKLTVAYWNFIKHLTPKTITGLDVNKTLAFRYGLFDTDWLDERQLKVIKSIPLDKDVGESIYYMDEWFKAIGKEEVRASVLDETVVAKKKGGNTSEKLSKRTRTI